MFLAFAMLMIFAGCMLVAAVKDAMTMTIPNWVSVAVVAAFFVMTPFVWQGWPVFGEHLMIGTGAFVFGFVLFALGWLGGGDAKLLAATSYWWVAPDLALYVFYTTLAGGAMAITILLARRLIPSYMLTSPKLHHIIKEQTHMPYGLALAFGALATLPQSEIFKAAVGTL